MQKLTSSSTTIYVYDAFGGLAAEYTMGGPSEEAGTFYRTTDHLGSTRLVTDAEGDVVSLRDFFPFGEQIAANSSSGRAGIAKYNEEIGFPQLFTGKERDEESDLDYFGARYTSSALGRFTSVDPVFATASLFNPQSWNGYAYVLNRPHGYVDPSGEVPIPVITGLAGAGAGALVGGGAEALSQYLRTGSVGSIQWGTVGTAALGGGIAGGIAGATFGVGSAAGVGVGVGQAITVNAASSTVGGIVQRGTNEWLGLEDAPDFREELGSVGLDAFTGTAGGFVGGKLGDKYFPIPNVRRQIKKFRFRWKNRDKKISALWKEAERQALFNSVVGGVAGGIKTELWKAAWHWFTTQWFREPACVETSDSATGDRAKHCE